MKTKFKEPGERGRLVKTFIARKDVIIYRVTENMALIGKVTEPALDKTVSNTVMVSIIP